MDKEKLFDDIRLQLNDTDKLEFQDSELQSALTACLFEIQKDLMSVNSPLLLKKITLVSSETVIDPDLLRIISIYDKNNTHLRLCSKEHISDNSYKVFGDKIIINNPPAEMIYYSKSETVILNSFYDIIVDYIVSVCLARINNNSDFELKAMQVLRQRVKSYSYGLTGSPVLKRYDSYSV